VIKLFTLDKVAPINVSFATIIDVYLIYKNKKLIVRFLERFNDTYSIDIYFSDGFNKTYEEVNEDLKNKALVYADKIIKEANYIPAPGAYPGIYQELSSSMIKKWYLNFRMNSLFSQTK
jgi:hypothetical protein